MRARELNQGGIELFRSFLGQVRLGTAHESTLRALLASERYGSLSPLEMNVEFQTFRSRSDLAAFLSERFEAAGVQDLPYRPGFWTWLAVLFFAAITPRRPRGSVAVREDARYVYTPTYDRDYRHRIAGPTRVYWAFRDDPARAALLLWGPPYELSDYEEQLMARLSRAQNLAVIEVANRLYFDPAAGRPKPGGQRGRPGTLRRLLRVFDQYERTYDLYSMNAEQILGLLPGEFDEWKAA